MNPIVGIELLNSKNNMDTTRKLAGLWSFIIVSLFKDFGVKVNSINTKSAKKITTGDGSADKEKIIKYVNKYFKLKLKYNKNKDLSDDDIADSISIALSLSRLHKEGLLNDE